MESSFEVEAMVPGYSNKLSGKLAVWMGEHKHHQLYTIAMLNKANSLEYHCVGHPLFIIRGKIHTLCKTIKRLKQLHKSNISKEVHNLAESFKFLSVIGDGLYPLVPN